MTPPPTSEFRRSIGRGRSVLITRRATINFLSVDAEPSSDQQRVGDTDSLQDGHKGDETDTLQDGGLEREGSEDR